MKTPWNWLVTLAVLDRTNGALGLETTITREVQIPALSMESPCQDFVAWMPPRSQPAVLLQVVSKHYLALQLNFIYHMELHSTFARENLYILCLDEESSTILNFDLGIHCVKFPHEEGTKHTQRRDVWELRVKAVSCLLVAGHDVLLSDADAIWLKDPMDSIDDLGANDSNVVATRGSSIPSLYQRWGSTACFGFILFRAGGTGMPILVEEMTKAMSKTHDDQRALNFALASLGIEWDPNSDMGYDNSTRLGRGTVAGLADGDEEFVVSFLPHSTFTRLCDTTPISQDTVVAHCKWDVKGEGMSVWMERANLWKAFDYNTVARQFSLP